jgi:hypothetical protein
MHPLFKTYIWLIFAIVCLQLTLPEVFVIMTVMAINLGVMVQRTVTIQTRRDLERSMHLRLVRKLHPSLVANYFSSAFLRRKPPPVHDAQGLNELRLSNRSQKRHASHALVTRFGRQLWGIQL